MGLGGQAAMFLYDGRDGRVLACNDAGRDLLGPTDELASVDGLRGTGRQRLRRPDGTTVAVDVVSDEPWSTPDHARLVVARTANGTDLALPLLERLLGALERHEAGAGNGVALLFVDADAAVDDTVLLGTIEARLRDAVRRTDLVCRVGPARFAVVCEPVRGELEAAGLAASLLDELSLIVAHADVGIALPGDPGMSVDALTADPTAATDAARTQGRARHAAFSVAADTRSRRHAVLAQSLRRALEAGELEVHYQPLVDLTEGAVRGVEALARWRPPGLPPIGPDRFIPVAERSGLIVELGEWVLGEACRFAADHPDLRVAVNLSPRQVAGDLVARVVNALDANAVEPERLDLELTESAVLDDPDTASDVLAELTGLGVHLALDDFGTGYSSLVVLRRLPFDRLKVDRSFVRTVADTPADRDIVAAVVGLARAVGVEVTAEGVETIEQATVLADLGCGEAQGYLFAAPMTPDACEVWLGAAR
jgi:EAL domain-containing protein (putative c-di-GMP-specific phosphodiesterase class I)/GGDEF domain-containing protein